MICNGEYQLASALMKGFYLFVTLPSFTGDDLLVMMIMTGRAKIDHMSRQKIDDFLQLDG